MAACSCCFKSLLSEGSCGQPPRHRPIVWREDNQPVNLPSLIVSVVSSVCKSRCRRRELQDLAPLAFLSLLTTSMFLIDLTDENRQRWSMKQYNTVQRGSAFLARRRLQKITETKFVTYYDLQ